MIIAISGRINSGKDTIGRIIQYLTSVRNYDKTFKEWGEISKTTGRYYAGYSNWQIKKFADKLKDIVCLLIGCTREQLEDETFKNTELGEEWWYFKGRNGSLISYSEGSKRSDEDLIKTTPRLLLQLLGTDCGRNIIHPNIWVNSLMNEYKLIRDTKVSEFLKAEGLPETMNGGKEYYPNWIITDMRFLNEMEAVKKRGGITIRVNRNLEESKNQHESETALDNAEFDYVIDNNGTIEELIEEVKQILIKENLL